MKRTAILFVALLLLLSAVQLVSAAAEAPKPWRIVFVNALVGHPVYNDQDRGILDAVKDFGPEKVDVQIIGSSDTNGLAEKTIEFIDQAIAMKPDAIVCEPWDPSMFAAIDRAVEAGIPVMCTSNKPDDMGKIFAFTGTDNVQYGIDAAEALAKKMDGKANIMIMMSKLDISNQVESRDAFVKTLEEKYPEMKVVLVEFDDANLQTATEKFDAAYRAYPEINAVFMLEGTGAQAAAAIAKEQNREVVVLGVDPIKETLDGIRNGGIWGTMAQNFYKRGYESIRFCVEYLEGNTDAFVKENDSGLVLVTLENVETINDDLANATRKVGTPLK
ncbi:MAG: sugar ABC transporter substrate-binding protein [Clostridiales bacterium]|nr:sugar ABC transporter substrate-binding protein [Clostridiales bacterium]